MNDYIETSGTAAALDCDTTVCIPVFNGVQYLRECLDSVALQADVPFIALIVDNASSDGTEDLCRAYSDPRFFYIRNPENVGSIRNHNRCLDLVRTKYAKLLSADDVLQPGTLALQRAALDADTGAALATCNCTVTGPDLTPISETHYLPGKQQGVDAIAACVRQIANLIGGPSNTLLRMSAVGENRFDTAYKWLADLDFHCRVLNGGSYVNIDRSGFFYRRHSATDTAVGCPPDIRYRDERAFVRQYAVTPWPWLRLQARMVKRSLIA